MRTDRKFETLARAIFLLSLCPVAGCASRTETLATAMPSAISTEPSIESSGSGDISKTVTIVGPRPLTQTPGLFSFNGLSLTSPLAEPELPTALSTSPNNFFAGMTGGMPHRLLLGSAPSPTPDDLCVYGSNEPHCFTDPSRKERRQYIADPVNPGHFREVRPGDEKIVENQIRTEKLIHQSLFWLEK